MPYRACVSPTNAIVFLCLNTEEEADINSNSAWLNLKEAKNSKVTICITAGWLIRADKDVHIIVGDVNFEDNGTLGDVGNITTMPTVNVIKIRKIKT